ncbi:PmoA family protein [Streptomyces sp. NPDC055082]|uniref:PmoA family protein n=1 Tax=Streptomyces sp. NPDC055082 TaxID=3365718 RepID=UPI0037D2A082
MSSPLRITHARGDRITVTDESGGVDLISYVYRPEAAWEAPKPYLHPIRTLGDNVVTDYRPNDHRWHKGLQMTASHLSGQNLWGGNTYVHGQDYVPLPERVGSMAHLGFDEVAASDGRAVVAERLSWRHHDGTHWADELRRIEVHDVEYAPVPTGTGATAETGGSWTLTWSSAITNRRAEPLRFGSPTTHGREAAGYTGLFWRGPRAFRGGRVLGPEGEGPGLMGTQAPWLAYSGEHDGADGHGTLIFRHAPENDHMGKDGTHPAHWFVRNEPFAAVAPSFAFFDELELAPGDTLARRYRVTVADGAWDRGRIETYLEEHPW